MPLCARRVSRSAQQRSPLLPLPFFPASRIRDENFHSPECRRMFILEASKCVYLKIQVDSRDGILTMILRSGVMYTSDAFKIISLFNAHLSERENGILTYKKVPSLLQESIGCVASSPYRARSGTARRRLTASRRSPGAS